MITPRYALVAATGSASESQPLLVLLPVFGIAVIALLVVLLVARHIFAPGALVEAGSVGGVVIQGGPAMSDLLRFGDPTIALPDLHPYLVLDPSGEVLVIMVGRRPVEIHWDEIRSVEHRAVGLRGRPALFLTVSRGMRPRSAVLRLVEEPGILGLRPASGADVDRFRRRLLARVADL